MFSLFAVSMLAAPSFGADSCSVLQFDVGKIEIPINYDPAKKNTISELKLYVSEDKGVTWTLYSTVKPDADCFRYEALHACVASFALQIVDVDGKSEPVDLKKLVPAWHVRFGTVANKWAIDDPKAVEEFWRIVRRDGRQFVERTSRTIVKIDADVLKMKLDETRKEVAELRRRIEQLEKARK